MGRTDGRHVYVGMTRRVYCAAPLYVRGELRRDVEQPLTEGEFLESVNSDPICPDCRRGVVAVRGEPHGPPEDRRPADEDNASANTVRRL